MATRYVSNCRTLDLLIKETCAIFRQLFQKSWKTKHGRNWSGTQADMNIVLTALVQNLGKLPEYTILTGDVNTWDLATLCTILTSRDFLNLTDKETLNINHLANTCNKLAENASKGITDDDLFANWCAAKDILVEFCEWKADSEILTLDSQVRGVTLMEKEPIDEESTLEARKLKEAGNAQFRTEDWAESIKIYTKAILLPGISSADRATLYSNRSIAFLKQNELSLALEDAKKSVELWPEWWRGYYRMGQVYTEMKMYKKAEACFDEAYTRELHREEIVEARSYARLKHCQLDRIDAVYPHLPCKSLDDIVSYYKRQTAAQVDEEVIRRNLRMLLTESDDPNLQNIQDCMKGINCLHGTDGFRRDYGAAAQHFKKAADRGCAGGMFELALLTMEGKGVKRDMKLGIRMLRDAAEKPLLPGEVSNSGIAGAEHALGTYYQEGVGVPKDLSAAMNWYKRASEHGSIAAANNLGVLYRIEKNFVKAEQYLKIAANAEDVKAMLNLADFYYSDRSDPESAITWCQRARNAGMVGPEIDYIEKSCKDVVRAFNASDLAQ